MGSQSQPAESQPTPTPEPTPQTVTLTYDQLQNLLTTGIAHGVAEVLKQQKSEAAPAVTDVPSVAAATPAKTESSVKLEGGLFGNLDTEKEFDFSKLVPGLTEFPKDKVAIVIQTYSKDAAGDESETKKLRRAQFIDLADFIANTKKDPETGDTLYDVMQLRYTPVHDPRK